jgi:peptidoglycan/xylan/chitin deacetylase (PgdA/CDA1 family)
MILHASSFEITKNGSESGMALNFMLRNNSDASRIFKYFLPMAILLYHEVTDFPERAKKTRKISPADSLIARRFEEQMALISERPNTKVITADDIFIRAQNNSKKIVLTFDDGLIGNYLFAFNILEKYGFKATFFVTVDSISKIRYMSWEQLSVLYKHGHSIQSHTMTHPMLGECDESQITYELEASKKIIEDKIGAPVKYLSLPFGSLNERVTKIAEDTGYEAIFTSSSHSRNPSGKLYQLGRIHVKDTYSLKKFMRLIDSNPTQFLLTRTNEVLKRLIKQIVGLNNYRKLYRFMYRIEL